LLKRICHRNIKNKSSTYWLPRALKACMAGMTSCSESQHEAVTVRVGSLSTMIKFLLITYPVEKALISLKSLADGQQGGGLQKQQGGGPQRQNFRP